MSAELQFLLSVKDEARKAFSDLRSHVQGAASDMGSLAGKAASLTPLAGVAAGIGAAFSFKEALGTTSELASEITKLQRETGMSAAEASKMHFAWQETGVSFESGEKSLKIFMKGLAGVSGEVDGVTIPGSKQLKLLLKEVGVTAEDSTGKLRPMPDVLGDVADKVKELGPGSEATALSMKLFGKAGADMLPLLLKGREGIKGLGDEAQKFGLVLDQKTLDAMKKQKIATREMHAAFEGVSVQIGVMLAPLMTYLATLAAQLAVALNEYVIPVIRSVAGWLSDHLGPAFSELGENVKHFIQLIQAFASGDTDRMITLFTSLPEPMQSMALALVQIVGAAQNLGQIFRNDVLPALIELGGIVADKLEGPLRSLLKLIKDHQQEVAVFAAGVVIGIVVPAFIAWAASAGAAAVATIAATAPVIAIGLAIGLLSVAIFEVIKHHDAIRDKIMSTWGAISTFMDEKLGALVLIARFYFETIKNEITTAINIVKDVIKIVMALIHGDWGEAWAGIKALFSDALNGIVTDLGLKFGFLRDAAVMGGEMLLNVVRDLGSRFVSAIWSGLGDLWQLGWNIIDWIKQGIEAALGGLMGLAESIGGKIKDTLNPANIAGGLGIPGFASGGVTAGGWAVVGERGPELAKLPAGTRIYPHGQAPAGAGSGAANVYINTLVLQGDPQAAIASLIGYVKG